MEPDNRPYVDTDTKPGDAGTEEWADNPRGIGVPAVPVPVPGPVDAPIDDGIVDGSPAEAFVAGPAAIASHSDALDGARKA